jgi:hypothetical protein
VTAAATRLLHDLTTTAPPRDREVEARKARLRAQERYARASEQELGPRAGALKA